MKYLIYKITNLINKKFYISAHATENENDDYFGSGVVITKAIKRYGKQNFIKEVLCECKDRELMFNEERKIVNQELINNTDCYNLCIGGFGSRGHKMTDGGKESIRKSRLGKKLSEDIKRKMSLSHIGIVSVKKHSDESRLKMSQSLKGREFSNETILKFKQRKPSEESRLKMRLSHLGKKHTQEEKDKISIGNIGKIRTFEQNFNNSIAQKRRNIVRGL